KSNYHSAPRSARPAASAISYRARSASNLILWWPPTPAPCETALDLPAFARALPPVLKPLSFRLSCVRKNSSQQSVIASLVRTHPSRRAPARIHSSGVEFGHGRDYF